MEELMNYIKPELVLVSLVLYFIGMWFKKASFVKDKYIPLLLGGTGVLLCGIWVFSNCSCSSPKELAMAVFTTFTQGILVAGLSTYINQIIKQAAKNE